MPASMAACRTVLPFSTVTDRPSIVSVTVSITFEYSSRALTLPPDNLHQFPVVLVVHVRAEDAAFAADVAETVAEVHGALGRIVHRPLPHVFQDRRERVVALLVLRVERGEVLREALAQPLLVIVAPANSLAPPLVRHLMRDE